MIEAPEALLLSEQINKTLKGKLITDVVTQFSPHKFAWFYKDPDNYSSMLVGKKWGEAKAYGGIIYIEIEDARLLLSDGVNLHYIEPGEDLPNKHQLLIGFEDHSCITASVRMYGGLWCFIEGDFDCPFTPYLESAMKKPQVMSDAFTLEYFLTLINSQEKQKKSAKAFLATEQTIPGLGNGMVQDILYKVKIHPKTKIKEINKEQKEQLYYSVKETLSEIYHSKGRNSETDLFGKKGNYIPYLSTETEGKPCFICGETIRKENYLGGSIYYCFGCQQE